MIVEKPPSTQLRQWNLPRDASSFVVGTLVDLSSLELQR